ncbi:hypothetical protein VTK73DRAFT_8244 [Phialemonium thermophilum]|uniref:Uncharacterized protein n=1 Tax=Phialemonium thermophilum TaxID=223376 RepID=A0ABR3XPW5_9PEZI
MQHESKFTKDGRDFLVRLNFSNHVRRQIIHAHNKQKLKYAAELFRSNYFPLCMFHSDVGLQWLLPLCETDSVGSRIRAGHGNIKRLEMCHFSHAPLHQFGDLLNYRSVRSIFLEWGSHKRASVQSCQTAHRLSSTSSIHCSVAQRPHRDDTLG